MTRGREKERSSPSSCFSPPSSFFAAAVKSRYISRQRILFKARAHVGRGGGVRSVSRQMIHARRRDAICKLSTGGLRCPCPPRRKRRRSGSVLGSLERLKNRSQYFSHFLILLYASVVSFIFLVLIWSRQVTAALSKDKEPRPLWKDDFFSGVTYRLSITQFFSFL